MNIPNMETILRIIYKHCVKTKKFLNNKKKFTSTELANGCCIMDIS
jgi:hypothetical protein